MVQSNIMPELLALTSTQIQTSTKTTEAILRKNKGKGTFPDLKLYYKDIVLKTE